jgi:hypothetical protein
MFCGTNSAGIPIYVGNGRVKFFECFDKDILEADKQLEKFCKVGKINWSKHPFTQVVCSF